MTYVNHVPEWVHMAEVPPPVDERVPDVAGGHLRRDFDAVARVSVPCQYRDGVGHQCIQPANGHRHEATCEDGSLFRHHAFQPPRLVLVDFGGEGVIVDLAEPWDLTEGATAASGRWVTALVVVLVLLGLVGLAVWVAK